MKRSVIAFLILLGSMLVLPATSHADTWRPLSNTDCSGGTATFTFDDGPGPNTPLVLSTLSNLGLTGIFFVNGNKIDGSTSGTQSVQQEALAGNLVENHTYDHASFTGASTGTAHLTQDQIISELNQTQTAIINAGLPAPTLYRPPYGDIDAWSDNIARSLGLRIVMSWSAGGTNTPIID